MWNVRNVVLAVVALCGNSVAADIVRVTIPIDGALCGFCMAGIESRFKAGQPGLINYRLSIRERVADLQFDGAHPVDVNALRKTIADYGYTPRDPIITVRGIPIHRQTSNASELWLEGVNVKERHLLLGADSPIVDAARKKTIVTVTGKLERDGAQEALRVIDEPMNNAKIPTSERKEQESEAAVSRRDWQREFSAAHLLEHSEALKLSSEQIAALRKINSALQEETRKDGEVAIHCQGEVFELLAQRMVLTSEDERIILHEAEEIAEARSKTALAEARAAVAAWKKLNPGQRKRWIEIVMNSSS